MSRRRNYSANTIATMQRFYLALETCINLGLLKSINRFCINYSIDKRHLYAQKKDLNKGLFEVSWLVPLIDDCGVSALWLMTGRGSIFNPASQ